MAAALPEQSDFLLTRAVHVSEISSFQSQFYHQLTSCFIQAEEFILSKDICIKYVLLLEVRRLRRVGTDAVHRPARHLLQGKILQNSCSEDTRQLSVSFILAAIAATSEIHCLLLKTVLSYLCEADSNKTQYTEKMYFILLISDKIQFPAISFCQFSGFCWLRGFFGRLQVLLFQHHFVTFSIPRFV